MSIYLSSMQYDLDANIVQHNKNLGHRYILQNKHITYPQTFLIFPVCDRN
jgi:hypothetical protein